MLWTHFDFLCESPWDLSFPSHGYISALAIQLSPLTFTGLILINAIILTIVSLLHYKWKVRTNQVLEDSMLRLQAAQEIGKMGDWEYDLESGGISWSRELYELFGRDPAEGPPDLETTIGYFLPPSRELLERAIGEAVETGEARKVDIQLELEGKKRGWRHAKIIPEKNQKGRVVRLKGTVQDISERKADESALRLSEKRFKVLVDNISLGFLLLDTDGVILETNPAMARMLGENSEEDLVGNNLTEWATREACEDVLDLVRNEISSAQGDQRNVTLLDRAGREMVFQINRIAAHSPEGARIAALCNDITYREQARQLIKRQYSFSANGGNGDNERMLEEFRILQAEQEIQNEELRETQKALTQAYDRYASLYNYAPFGYISLDSNGRIIESNYAFADQIGLSRQELHGRLFLNFVPPECQKDYKQFYEGIFTTGDRAHAEIKLAKSNRQIFHASIQGVTGNSGVDEAEKCRITILDITDRIEAQLALQESEKRYRLMIENTDTGIIVLNRYGRILECNESCARIFGKQDAEQLVQSDIFEYLPWEDRKMMQDRIDICTRTGKLDSLEMRIRPGNGKQRYALISATRENTSVGPCISAIVRDISSLKKVQKEQIRFFDLSIDFFCIADMEGRFISLNKAWETQLGYSREHIINENFADYVHPDDLDNTLQALNGLNAGENILHFENRFRDASGNYRWMSWNSAPYPEEGLIYGVCRDVTEQKSAQEKMGALIAELRAANAELEEFSYAASHDLQEPLRTLSNFCGLLETDLGDSASERALEDMRHIFNASKRMQKLVSDLLDLSRAGRREIQLEEVDLNECLDECLEMLAMLIEQKGARIVSEGLPQVRGDRGMLIRVFQNLIGNALKFSGDNRPYVQLSASVEGSFNKIIVQDNGIGIDPRYQEQIFLPFKRLASYQGPDGTGIGLAICRKIVQRHGGSIWLDASNGIGSRFCFTILD
ncbi:MAG: PAS domain S-box protein [Candidatus Sumerlaeia bacterium]